MNEAEEQGFTVRHKGSALTYPIPLLVDALVFARRRGCGWFVTRDSPDKFGRCHVPMSWIPTVQIYGPSEDRRTNLRRSYPRKKNRSAQWCDF